MEQSEQKYVDRILSAVTAQAEWEALAEEAGASPVSEAWLWKCFLSPEAELARKAGYVLAHFLDKYPDRGISRVPELVQLLHLQGNEARRRIVFRYFQDVPIPEEVEGELLDLCFHAMENPQEPAAIRVFAMTVAHRISLPYPELMDEWKKVVEAHLPFGSAGFRARAKNLMAQKKS